MRVIRFDEHSYLEQMTALDEDARSMCEPPRALCLGPASLGGPSKVGPFPLRAWHPISMEWEECCDVLCPRCTGVGLGLRPGWLLCRKWRVISHPNNSNPFKVSRERQALPACSAGPGWWLQVLVMTPVPGQAADGCFAFLQGSFLNFTCSMHLKDVTMGNWTLITFDASFDTDP